MNVVRSLPEKRWSRFVAKHPVGNVFHTPEMFRVFERAAGHQPSLWAVVDDDEHILALLLPVEITVLDGPLRRLSNRAVVYGGVLCAPGTAGETALDQLLRAYRAEMDRRVLFTELRNVSELNGLQPVLDTRGFAYEDHLNYLVDLARPVDEIMQDIGRRTRKQIRRAMRQGDVVVEEVTDRQGLAECYELLRQTYSRARVPLADRSLFEAAFDLLRPRGMVRFTLARVEGRPAACSVDLLYKDVAYGWYGGMDRDYGAHVPNELLTWHVLSWAAEHGYRQYDFGGAGKPDEDYGVREFKSKFGGELVCYGRNTCVHAPLLLSASKLGYDLVRRLGLFGTAARNP